MGRYPRRAGVGEGADGVTVPVTSGAGWGVDGGESKPAMMSALTVR